MGKVIDMNKKLAVLALCLLVTGLNGAAAHPTDALADVTTHTVFAAGDISSCSNNADMATAKLIGSEPGRIIMLGDNAYPDGSAWQYANCFDPIWGVYKARIRPVPGNHEYHQKGAAPYFKYFGAAAGPAGKGYYSFDLGGWHMVALNSNCSEIGGCGAGSPQWRWLYEDLKKNTKKCTAAYWHAPLFTAGNYSGKTAMRSFWQLLYIYGAEIVMSGHDHNYQRFSPQDPRGNSSPTRGIRQFVVGTGGATPYSVPRSIPNLDASNGSTYGILRLRLGRNGYTSEFLQLSGSSSTDIVEGTCIDPPVPAPSISAAFTPGAVTGKWRSGSLSAASWTKFSGIIKGSDGTRIAGATVYIQNLSRQGWKTVSTVTSDHSGYFSKRIQPRATSEYRALARPFTALGVDRWTASSRVKVSVNNSSMISLSDTSTVGPMLFGGVTAYTLGIAPLDVVPGIGSTDP